MNKIFMLMMLCLAVGLSGMSGEVYAGVGSVLARSAARRAAGKEMAVQVEKKSAEEISALAKRDMERDRKLKPVALDSDIHVFRYTSEAQAKSDAKNGVKAGRHFTSKAAPGRPLASANASRRYSPTSSKRMPAVRQTWRLEKGTMVKRGKVLGGEPGYGEIVPLTEVPPQNLIGSSILH